MRGSMRGGKLGTRLLSVLLLCAGVSDAFLGLSAVPLLGLRSGRSGRSGAGVVTRMLDDLPYSPPPPGSQKLNKAQEKMIKDLVEKSKGSTKTKRAEFSAGAKSTAKVNDTGVPPNATLSTYMRLPADQWITMDDEYIERLDDGLDGGRVGYRFTVPLKKVMQVDLTATCDVFVTVDEYKQQLTFEAKEARIVTGDSDEDEEGKVVQVLGPNGTLVGQKLPANFSKSIEQSDMQMGFITNVEWREAGEWGIKNSEIKMNTKVNVGITLPPPLSFLPGIILRQAGGLVLKATSAALLPRFAALVAEDYRRWSRGEPRTGGSLMGGDNEEKLKDMYKLQGGAPAYTPPPEAAGVSERERRA